MYTGKTHFKLSYKTNSINILKLMFIKQLILHWNYFLV